MEFSMGGGGGVPPIRQRNYFFEKNIVVEKNLENCSKWSETWEKKNYQITKLTQPKF